MGARGGDTLDTVLKASLGKHLPLFQSGQEPIMNTAPVGEITTLLRAWSAGNGQALAELTPLVYQELYHAAKRCMAHEKAGHILQNTALVNEVYLRLAKIESATWHDRNHFFAFCAQIMRHVLVDQARSGQSAKRGANADHVSIEEAWTVHTEVSVNLLALDLALDRLSKLDKRKSQVVELRFFGGLNVKETAEVLNISEDTVIRDWKFAKDWLLSKLEGMNGHRG
jgi:RNA polymerase sigma-70 factor, ECF subfamily